ncbi:MAG: hypothetical protein ACT4TC_06125 [Myxococcaceae bacterium]
MNYPPRLAHLATRAVVIAKLKPTYAGAHHIDDEEAGDRLERALSGSLLPQLLEATWTAMKGNSKRLTEAGLLEKVAGTLKERPLRPGKAVEPSASMSAFLLWADVEAGTASDAARRVLERDDGRRRAEEGLLEVGKLLAAELTKGR